MHYLLIETCLENNNADMTAAEAHGLAVAMLSVAMDCQGQQWLELLMGDEQSLSDDDSEHLLQWFEQTRSVLDESQSEYAFDLFLPDDDTPLPEQAQAFSAWCQGYLYGLGYGHADKTWPGELGEIVQDIVELSKLECDSDDEDDVQAFVEICEYLRIAVFTAKAALQTSAAQQLH
jgi:yecA family protein